MKSFDQLRPTHIAKTVEGITPTLLDENELGLDQFGAIAFDVDGTLMAHHETRVEHTVNTALRGLGDAGYKLYIISNAYGARVDELKGMFEYSDIGATVITPEYVTPRGENAGKYRKPSPVMIERAAYETDGDVLMVGDQMVKDVWSANRADMPSVLVPRRGDGDDPRVKYLQRPIETAARIYLDLPRNTDDYPDTLRAA